MPLSQGALWLLLAALLIGAAVATIGPAAGMERLALLPVVAAAAFFLLADPYRPLMLLVASVTADAFASRLLGPVPMSPTTALVLLVFAGLVLQAPREPRAQRLVPDDIVIRWVAAFVVALGLSAILADDRGEALDAGGRILGMVLLAPLIIRIADTRHRLRGLVLAFVGATLFSSAVLVIETWLGYRLFTDHVSTTVTGQFRSAGASDHNPTTAALMLATGVIMALTLALEYPRFRALTFAAAAIGAAAVVYSYARSALLVLLAVAPLIAWRHRRSRYLPLGVVVVLGLALASVPLVPDEYTDRLLALVNVERDYTLARRLGYNMIGLDLVAQDPLLGVGPGNYPQHYIDADYRYMPGRTLTPRVLHNLYLGIAAELGLVGLLAFLAAIAVSLFRLARAMAGSSDSADRAFAAAILLGATGYFLGSLVTPSQFLKLTWILIGLAAAQARVMGKPPSQDEDRNAPGRDRQ